jgi:hypothetical protein
MFPPVVFSILFTNKELPAEIVCDCVKVFEPVVANPNAVICDADIDNEGVSNISNLASTEDVNASNDEVIPDALLNNSTSVANVSSNAPLRYSNSLPTDIFCVVKFSTTGIILPVVILISVGNCEILGIS